MRFKNIKVIKQQMREHKRATNAAITRGIAKVGMFVQRESQKLSPVDTGNMRAAANVRLQIKTTTKGASAKIVFVAAYAIFVHENLTAHHEVGENKFLTKAVMRNLERIKVIFYEEVTKS
jgi:hypothetical protein